MPLTIEFETSLRQIHAFSSLQIMRHKLSEHIRMFSGIEWQQKNLKSITNSPISVGDSAGFECNVEKYTGVIKRGSKLHEFERRVRFEVVEK